MAKRKWDLIDIEAESEGRAVRNQLIRQLAKRPLGKKIIAERKMGIDATYAIQRKLVKCVEKEK